MYKTLTFCFTVLIMIAMSSKIQAQPVTYAFDGAVFSYGTINLSTGAFTSLSFIPQGNNNYPVSGDNDGTDGQYAIMTDFNLSGFYLWHINFTALTSDSIAVVGPLASGQTQIKALAHNTTNDTWYVISGDDFGTAAVLYTMDINTGTLTEVGNIQNANVPITLSIDCDGNAFIVNVEIGASTTAVLYSLDLTTAAATQVGTNLGFDNVTFGSQDMDFNPDDGKLYWTAYWSDGFFNEGGSFRVIDVTNGTSTEIGTFGQFETITGFSVNANCPVLPVELNSFSASIDGNSIVLNWSTATETNNAGFDIERSTDNNTFYKIAFTPGFGTTTELKNYSFSDNQLKEGKYYYRLKQKDLDGSFKYSNTIEVVVTTPKEYTLKQNYPNPFNPTTRIVYSIPTQGFVNLTVYNTLGQEVATLVNNVVTAGQHTINFNATNLSSGIYFYRITAGNYVDVKKMNLLK